MKELNIGINGFGRIGRSIFRNIEDISGLNVVRINDINPDIDNMAYTINYDSTYGRSKNRYTTSGKNLLHAGTSFSALISHEAEIDRADWTGIDILIDASGIASNVQRSKNIDTVKKIITTHCHPDVDFTMVLGANEEEYDPVNHNHISSSICDATALAPVMKLLNSKFGIKNGSITTLHPWLNYQNLSDGSSASWSIPGQTYGHYELGRASVQNMIPKPTTAITATCQVLDNISTDKIGSFSYRTPHPIVGSADLSLNLSKDCTKEDVNRVFEEAQESQSFEIFYCNYEPLISCDFIKHTASAIVDLRWTDVVDNRLLKIVLWYDNEYGYSARVVDQVLYIGSFIDE